MSKTAVVPVEAKVVAGTEVEEQKALELDQAIDQNIHKLGSQMAETYLTIGQQLKEMKNTEGWKFLGKGYDSWSEYLNSKTTYGKTYMSYLLRLGMADQKKLAEQLEKGLTGTHLIEYAKATTKPDKIPTLIEKTWGKISDQPTRDGAKVIKAYVAKNKTLFKDGGKGGGRPKASLEQKVRTFLAKLEEGEQMRVALMLNNVNNVDQMKKFIAGKLTLENE